MACLRDASSARIYSITSQPLPGQIHNTCLRVGSTKIVVYGKPTGIADLSRPGQMDHRGLVRGGQAACTHGAWVEHAHSSNVQLDCTIADHAADVKPLWQVSNERSARARNPSPICISAAMSIVMVEHPLRAV